MYTAEQISSGEGIEAISPEFLCSMNQQSKRLNFLNVWREKKMVQASGSR